MTTAGDEGVTVAKIPVLALHHCDEHHVQSVTFSLSIKSHPFYTGTDVG